MHINAGAAHAPVHVATCLIHPSGRHRKELPRARKSRGPQRCGGCEANQVPRRRCLSLHGFADALLLSSSCCSWTVNAPFAAMCSNGDECPEQSKFDEWECDFVAVRGQTLLFATFTLTCIYTRHFVSCTVGPN